MVEGEFEKKLKLLAEMLFILRQRTVKSVSTDSTPKHGRSTKHGKSSKHGMFRKCGLDTQTEERINRSLLASVQWYATAKANSSDSDGSIPPRKLY